MSDERRWPTAASLGCAVALLGLLAAFHQPGRGTLLGWVFIDPPPMPPATAAALLISGLALILVRRPTWRGVVWALVGLLWILAFAGLLVPIGELPPDAVPHALAQAPGQSPFGLMAPNSALGFLLFALILVLDLSVPHRRRRARLLGTLGPVLVALAAIALFGGAAEIESPYRWGNLHRMAQPTAISFLMLGLGVVSLAWDDARLLGAQPLWLPMAVSGALAIGSLLAWQSLTRMEMRQIQTTIAAEAELVRGELASRLDSRSEALGRMAKRWARHGRPTREDWEFDAGLYLEHYVGLVSIAWIDSTYQLRWLVPADGRLDPGRMPSGRVDWRGRLASLRTEPGPHVGDRVPLPRGGTGPLVAVALQDGGRFDGFLVGAVDPRMLVERSLDTHRLRRGYAAEIRDGQTLVYRHGPDPDGIPEGYHQTVPLSVDHLHWTIEIWPDRRQLDRMTRPLATLLLFAGLALSWLMGMTVRLTQRANARADEAEAANTALAREVRVREGAEAALARQTEDLRRSNADLEQFAYVASHDLQEPLRMVASYLQLIERRYRDELDDDGREFIDYAVDGANRMRTLINDLLAYSRVGTRGKPFEECNLNAVFEQAVGNLRLAIDEAAADVTKSQLPTVHGDPGQLTQLMQNLIGNAIKFRGEAAPRVSVEASQQGGEWVCVVRDNGIGIAPEYAERVFLIFQRLHSRAEYDGTGIGLAICKRIVERHGGRIWLQSQPGEGTEVWWTLPVGGEGLR